MAQTYDPVASLNELIKGIGIAMLTTIRPHGGLHSCPMAARAAESNGVIWFLTSSNTEKVEAVKTMQRVNVSYADPGTQRYVSVSGFCELIRDHGKAKELWDPSDKSWFSGGLEDPNLILLKINVQEAEYWDPAVGRMVELLGFNRPVIS